jgi:RimJ/RimL family protein N-acetyltransferase
VETSTIERMLEFPRTITDYWDGLFACGEVIQADQDLTITINPNLSPQRRVMLLRQADGMTRAALTPQIANLLSLPSPHGGAQLLPLQRFRARLAEVGVVLHPPDRILYYLAAMQPWPVTVSEAAARELSERDAAAFTAFQSEASEQDQEAATFVELDHWAVFGVFEQERLVSAASMYPWDNAAIADLGVLTLPGWRGKGYARALVRSISRHALGRAHQPQYRCQLDNSASTALARAAGFSLFGLWEVVSPDCRAVQAQPS